MEPLLWVLSVYLFIEENKLCLSKRSLLNVTGCFALVILDSWMFFELNDLAYGDALNQVCGGPT